MTKQPDYIEGAEAFTRFRTAMQKIVTVSREEITRRVEAERQASALNPHRRGRKPKSSSPASAA
jgi:hypothetical protein